LADHLNRRFFGRVAQRESTPFTREGSQVQSLSRPPCKPLFFAHFYPSREKFNFPPFRSNVPRTRTAYLGNRRAKRSRVVRIGSLRLDRLLLIRSFDGLRRSDDVISARSVRSPSGSVIAHEAQKPTSPMHSLQVAEASLNRRQQSCWRILEPVQPRRAGEIAFSWPLLRRASAAKTPRGVEVTPRCAQAHVRPNTVRVPVIAARSWAPSSSLACTSSTAHVTGSRCAFLAPAPEV
jgi:hypothetical protein